MELGAHLFNVVLDPRLYLIMFATDMILIIFMFMSLVTDMQNQYA